MNAIIDALKGIDTTGNPKLKKAIAIIETVHIASAMILKTGQVAFPRKRAFRKIERRPLKGIQKKQLRH